MSAHERTAIAATAYVGTRFAETRRHSWPPGTAPSRENANIIRDAAVTDASPQKNCATQAITSRNSAQRVLIDVFQMYVMSNAPALSVPVTSGIAKVIATSRMNPKI